MGVECLSVALVEGQDSVVDLLCEVPLEFVLVYAAQLQVGLCVAAVQFQCLHVVLLRIVKVG